MNVLKAIRWGVQAWEVDLKMETIQKCFQKALTDPEIDGTDSDIYSEITRDLARLQLSSPIHNLIDIDQFIDPKDEVVEDDIERLDEQILAQFGPEIEVESDEETEVLPKISNADALEALKKLRFLSAAILGTVSAMPEFTDYRDYREKNRKDFGQLYEDEWIIPSEWLALWNAASPLGVMVGAIVAGLFQDRAGRRWSLVLGSVPSAISVAICYVLSQSDELDTCRGIFFLGEIAYGFSIGMVMCTAQTYMSEILPLKLRGPILAFFPIFILLGQLAGAVVVFTSLSIEGHKSYTIPFASQLPFSGVLIVIAGVVPEIPAYLLQKRRMDAAFKAQKRPDTKHMDAQAELDRLLTVIQVEEQRTRNVKYIDCFKGTSVRRTWIVVFSHMLSQIFGLTLLSNASCFMQVVGDGRQQQHLIPAFGNRAGSCGMGIAGCFTGVVMIWWAAVTMMVIIVICGIGMWPASYVVGGEVSALHLRAKAQGVGWFVQGLTTGIFNIVLPYIYNHDQGDVRAKTGFVYAVFCLIGFVLSWLTIPEMKGRTAMEIDRMFELKQGSSNIDYNQLDMLVFVWLVILQSIRPRPVVIQVRAVLITCTKESQGKNIAGPERSMGWKLRRGSFISQRSSSSSSLEA
ncbi:hypothetical protein VTO42DRAFT_5292 [Malbranchea cinnamomea]